LLTWLDTAESDSLPLQLLTEFKEQRVSNAEKADFMV
jgi:hypothetical protein